MGVGREKGSGESLEVGERKFHFPKSKSRDWIQKTSPGKPSISSRIKG